MKLLRRVLFSVVFLSVVASQAWGAGEIRAKGLVAAGEPVVFWDASGRWVKADTNIVYATLASTVVAIQAGTNDWATAFSWGDHSIAGYLTAESDVLAMAAVVVLSNRMDVVEGNTNNWDAAFGWGDHSIAGYLTAESDVLAMAAVVVLSNRMDVVEGNTNGWDTAFGWGDHSVAGYLTVETDPVWVAASNGVAYLDSIQTFAETNTFTKVVLLSTDATAGTEAVNYQTMTNAIATLGGGGGGSGDAVKADYNTFTNSNKLDNAVGTTLIGAGTIGLDVRVPSGAPTAGGYFYNAQGGGLSVSLATDSYGVDSLSGIRGASVRSTGGAALNTDGTIGPGQVAAATPSGGTVFLNSGFSDALSWQPWYGNTPKVIAGEEAEISTGAVPSGFPTTTITPSGSYSWTAFPAIGTASWAVNVLDSNAITAGDVTTSDVPVFFIKASNGGWYEVEFEIDIECQSSFGDLTIAMATYTVGTPPSYQALMTDIGGANVFTTMDFPNSYEKRHGSFKRIMNFSSSTYVGLAIYAGDTYTYTLHQARFRIKQH